MFVHAEREAQKALTTVEFLNTTFRSVDPYALRGRELSFESVLTTAIARMDEGELIATPAVEANVRHTFGRVYRTLKMMPEQELQMRRAYELRRQIYGEDDARTLEAAVWVGDALQWQSEQRYQWFSKIAEVAERALGPNSSSTIHAKIGTAAWVVHPEQDWNRGEVLLKNLLQVDRRHFTAFHANWLGALVRNLGRNARTYADPRPPRSAKEAIAEGEALGRLAVKLSGPLESPPNLERHLEYRDVLAFTLLFGDGVEEAERLTRENFEIRRTIVGPGHEDYDQTIGIHIDALRARRKFDEANTMIHDYYEAIESVIDEAHSDALVRLGRWYLECGNTGPCDSAKSLPMLKIAIERASQQRTSNWALFQIYGYLAEAYFKTGDIAEAIETQEKAIALLRPDASDRGEYEAALARYRAALSSDKATADPNKTEVKAAP